MAGGLTSQSYMSTGSKTSRSCKTWTGSSNFACSCMMIFRSEGRERKKNRWLLHTLSFQVSVGVRKRCEEEYCHIPINYAHVYGPVLHANLAVTGWCQFYGEPKMKFLRCLAHRINHGKIATGDIVPLWEMRKTRILEQWLNMNA